jgi:hypothetical protein
MGHGNHKTAGPRAGHLREFLLRMLIPSALLALLLILLVANVPSAAFMPAILVTAVGLLAGGAVGLLTGIRGPHWVIYGLIFAGVAALLLAHAPWSGLALVCVPVPALGYSMGKEIAFFRVNRASDSP